MTVDQLRQATLALTEADRRRLARDILDSLTLEPPPDDRDFVLTPEMKAELDRRLADLDAHPDEVLTWDEVMASLRAKS
jgi:putative addiction module component (TIGR02574 family)